MPGIRLRMRALVVGVSVFALAALAAGGTFAGSNPTTLYACFDALGNVRMTDVPQCKLPGGGRLVYWGTTQVPGPTGAMGATGAAGPTGPTGPIGPAGAGGVRAWARVADDGTIVASQGVDSVQHMSAGFYRVWLHGIDARTAAPIITQDQSWGPGMCNWSYDTVLGGGVVDVTFVSVFMDGYPPLDTRFSIVVP